MAGNSAWKRELLEQLFHSFFVLADIRINLTIATFKISIAYQRWATVTWTGDIKHIKIMLLNNTVQVHIYKILTRCCAPVPNHHRLHMRKFQWLLQKWIIIKINLPDRQIVSGAPIGIHFMEQFRRKCFFLNHKLSSLSP